MGMKRKQLIHLGFAAGELLRLAEHAVMQATRAGMSKRDLEKKLKYVAMYPESHRDDPQFGELARAITGQRAAEKAASAHTGTAPWKQWGENLEPQAVEQMRVACRLPIAVRGALMPDAHLGYGLPIGGVLATNNAVIPYAVGVDIACRMKLTVLDLPVSALDHRVDTLRKAIEMETRFGVGATFKERRQHPVLDGDWGASPVTSALKDKAWAQLGTSGSGNHFVEFGVIEIHEDRLGPGPGTYLALLSHSGSRGTGAAVCSHYSKIARQQCRGLDDAYRHLAWLGLDTHEGQEYWAAMELMGAYAAANHACIHEHIARHLGAGVLLDIENHHNFAWKEEHDGMPLVVHRKGATPAGKGVLGVIPGTMATPAYVVRGRGDTASLNSASHGAGRAMSRTAAKKTLSWRDAQRMLDERGVTLMSAGLDEVPMVYKDIEEVMAAQSDLVDVVARFQPRLVKMAPAGERPED
jgi:tRNA-splicing ligase RtcB